MPRTVTLTAAAFALLGLFVGYSMAGIGGALLCSFLWGIGGLLIGRAIAKTAALVSRFWHVALAIAIFVLATILTWGVHV